MKKIFKKHWKAIIKAVLVLAAAIVAYKLAHEAATIERGYEAIGGEVFIPLLIIFGDDICRMIKAPFKALNERG